MRKLRDAAIGALAVLSVCAGNFLVQPNASAQPPATGQPPVPALKQEKARVAQEKEKGPWPIPGGPKVR